VPSAKPKYARTYLHYILQMLISRLYSPALTPHRYLVNHLIADASMEVVTTIRRSADVHFSWRGHALLATRRLRSERLGSCSTWNGACPRD
jgi:hypothetical protein